MKNIVNSDTSSATQDKICKMTATLLENANPHLKNMTYLKIL